MSSRRSDLQAHPRLLGAVERLTQSHASSGCRPPEAPHLPTMRAVVGILHDVEALLFPGFIGARDGEAHHRGDRNSLAECAARVVGNLTAEITRALEVSAKDAGPALAPPEEIALQLIEALASIRSVLDEDADAALEGDPAAHSLCEVILSYPSIRAIAVHRVAHFLHTRRVPLIPRMMSEYVHGQTGIDIHPGARIGPGLFIDHGTGVVIGETAVIGRRCKLYQGVTLGALSVKKVQRDHASPWNPPKRHPTLEDNVTVYAHATILGGETVIGAGSVIGGNVWLTRSVPPQTKVQIDPPNLLYRTAPGGEPVKEPLDYQI